MKRISVEAELIAYGVWQIAREELRAYSLWPIARNRIGAICYTLLLRFCHKPYALLFRRDTSDDLTLPISRLQYLKDETFQVARFRHGGEDGMVAGLSTLLKKSNLPLCISCSKTNARPQFRFSDVVRAGTRD